MRTFSAISRLGRTAGAPAITRTFSVANIKLFSTAAAVNALPFAEGRFTGAAAASGAATSASSAQSSGDRAKLAAVLNSLPQLPPDRLVKLLHSVHTRGDTIDPKPVLEAALPQLMANLSSCKPKYLWRILAVYRARNVPLDLAKLEALAVEQAPSLDADTLSRLVTVFGADSTMCRNVLQRVQPSIVGALYDAEALQRVLATMFAVEYRDAPTLARLLQRETALVKDKESAQAHVSVHIDNVWNLARMGLHNLDLLVAAEPLFRESVDKLATDKMVALAWTYAAGVADASARGITGHQQQFFPLFDALGDALLPRLPDKRNPKMAQTIALASWAYARMKHPYATLMVLAGSRLLAYRPEWFTMPELARFFWAKGASRVVTEGIDPALPRRLHQLYADRQDRFLNRGEKLVGDHLRLFRKKGGHISRVELAVFEAQVSNSELKDRHFEKALAREKALGRYKPRAGEQEVARPSPREIRAEIDLWPTPVPVNEPLHTYLIQFLRQRRLDTMRNWWENMDEYDREEQHIAPDDPMPEWDDSDWGQVGSVDYDELSDLSDQ